MKKSRLLLSLGLCLSVGASLCQAAPGINDILKKIDDTARLSSDCSSKGVMTEQKVGEGVKEFKFNYYRRDSDDSFLIIMTAPEGEKGNGYLKQADNFWMYRRNTRTFQHINRDENIAGTDSNGEDFENKKLQEMYKPVVDKSGVEKVVETSLGDIPVYQFELKAKVEDVAYPKRVYWVRKDNYLPLKVQSYSLNGTLMQTAYYLKYTKVAGKYLWTKGMFVDEFEKGNKTLVEIVNISLKKLDGYIFTKAYLENLNK